jgi:ADP-heptose:LPS heptosyltransferase
MIVIAKILNKLLYFFKIKFIFREGKSIGELIYLTSLVSYFHKLNYRVIVLTKYSEVFFNNKKIYFNLDSSKLYFLRKIIFKILFKLEGKNIINFNPLNSQLKFDEHFLKKYSRNTHLLSAITQKLGIIFDYRNVENEFFFSKKEEERLKSKLILPETYALIHSESKKTYALNKDWGPEKMQKVVELCNHIQWVQTGLSSDYCLKGAIHKFNLTIREMAFLVYKCKFLVSLEGVFNHLASCFKKKNFLILSGMLPYQATYYKNNIIISNTDKLKCYPCYQLNNCHIDGKPCTNGILVNDVVKKIRNLVI